MKLIDADRGRIVVEIDAEERFVINGLFSMIGALQNPAWENSTGQADTAMTPEQFDRIDAAWTDLLDQPGGKAFFVGKPD